MMKRLFALGLTMICAISAWADDEVYISKAKEWKFDGVTLETGTTTQNIDGLYFKGLNSTNDSYGVKSGSNSGTYSDGTEWSAESYAVSPAGSDLSGVTGERKALATTGSSFRRVFAFNISTPGTCYVIFGSNKTSGKFRIYFNHEEEGSWKMDTAEADISTTTTEVKYTATSAGTFWISATDTYYIYAIRFVPTETPSTSQYTLNVTAGTGGTVTVVQGSNDVTEAVAAGAYYDEGTTFTLTATASQGYEFMNWTNGSSDVVSAENPYTISSLAENTTLTANFQATTEPTEPVELTKVPVILTAGQSNTDGRALNDSLPYYIKNLGESYPNVYWSYGNGGIDTSTGTFDNYWPACDASGNPARWAYDAVVYYHLQKTLNGSPLYVIKESKGNTAINTAAASADDMYWSADESWLSTATSADDGGQSLLLAFTNNIDKCLTTLNNDGKEADIKFLMWHQGEADRSYAAAYQTQLQQVIDYVRSYLVERTGNSSYASLPVILGGINSTTAQYKAGVEEGKQAIANADDNIYYVSSEDFPATAYRQDNLHFNYKGAEMFGKRVYGLIAEKQLLGSYSYAEKTNNIYAPTISFDEDSKQVTITKDSDSDLDGTIYYTIDESTPTASSTAYSEPFTATQSGTIKAVCISGDITSYAAEKSVAVPSAAVTYNFAAAKTNGETFTIDNDTKYDTYYNGLGESTVSDTHYNFNPVTSNTENMPVNGRITWKAGTASLVDGGMKCGNTKRYMAIRNLYAGDRIQIVFTNGTIQYAKHASKGDAITDLNVGDELTSGQEYTIASVDDSNNYLVLYPTNGTIISQIYINKEEEEAPSTQEVTITAEATQAVTYNGKAQAVDASVSSGGITITYYTNETHSEGATTDAPVNAGTYYAVVTQNDDSYTSDPVNVTFTINRAALTATAGNASREVGAANPTFTVSVEGFVNGETAETAAGYVAPTASTAATTESEAGEYEITVSGGSADNYTFSYTHGTLTVTAAASVPDNYTITLPTDLTGGTITASPASAAEGTEVTMTITPDAGYEVDEIIVKDANDATVSVTDNKFTMPASAVTVTVTFKKKSLSVIAADGIENGSLSFASNNQGGASVYQIGDEVTISATPDSGYKLSTLTATDANANPVSITEGKFTMPGANVTVSATFEEEITEPTVATYDFTNNSISLEFTQGDVDVYYNRDTDNEGTSRHSKFYALTGSPVDGKISWSSNDPTIVTGGIKVGGNRAFAIHNLKEGDVIRIEFDGGIYFAKSTHSSAKGDVLEGMTSGDHIKNIKAYTVSSIDTDNNYVVFGTSTTTIISQISINQELTMKKVPKPTISSSYTVNEDHYSYSINYMEGATLYYTLPGGTEQTATGGESINVDVTKLGDLTAYAKYGEMTSETLTARVYAPTPKIESNGIYDFSHVSSTMLKDYALGTIGYGEDVTIGELTLHKPDDLVSKALDRFAFAPKLNESGKNAADWVLLSAGRLRSKNAVADTLAVLNLNQGEYITFTYSGGAELKYMSESTATLADGTDVLTSGQGYEVKTSGALLLTVPVTDSKYCDITKISIASEETVTAPTITLRDGYTNRATITPGTSSIGKSVTTYYTIDDTDPTTESTAITGKTNIGPFTTTTTVKAFSVSETGKSSEVSELVVTPDSYTITISGDITGGTVTANKTEGTQGETVRLTITPADGYSLETLTADNGAEISSDNTFRIPAANVTITATFKQTTNEAEEVKENVSLVDDSNAKITSLSIGSEVTTVTVSSNVNGVPVTSIGTSVFTATNTENIAAIDLSATAITLTGERSELNELKNINSTTLIYLPATANVEGTNVVTKSETDGSFSCTDYEITDSKDCVVPHDFTASTAKLSRTFTADKKCTVCLPFEFTATGGSFYKFTGINDGKVQMTALAEGATLSANTPYIYEPSGEQNAIAAANVEVTISDAPQTENTEAKFSFIGTYEQRSWDNPDGIYGFAAEENGIATIGQFVRVGSGASILACRAYLQYTGEDDLSGTTAQTRGGSLDNLPATLEIEWIPAAPKSTTAISEVERPAAEDAPIYNINGQRVDSSYKGLVIKNGKKIVKK